MYILKFNAKLKHLGKKYLRVYPVTSACAESSTTGVVQVFKIRLGCLKSSEITETLKKWTRVETV